MLKFNSSSIRLHTVLTGNCQLVILAIIYIYLTELDYLDLKYLSVLRKLVYEVRKNTAEISNRFGS